MIGVIDRLLAGDTSIAERFASAKRFWEDFFAAHRSDDAVMLARALSNAQSGYEQIFEGDRYLGKDTMAYTALATLYDVGRGFEDNRRFAVELVVAFLKSMVSLEVKSSAKRAATLYNLAEEPELENMHRMF